MLAEYFHGRGINFSMATVFMLFEPSGISTWGFFPGKVIDATSCAGTLSFGAYFPLKICATYASIMLFYVCCFNVNALLSFQTKSWCYDRVSSQKCIFAQWHTAQYVTSNEKNKDFRNNCLTSPVKKAELCLLDKTVQSECVACYISTWEKWVSLGAGREARLIMTSLFTLIMPIPVTVDGKNKGTSVSLFKVWTLQEQSRMRKPSTSQTKHTRGEMSFT